MSCFAQAPDGHIVDMQPVVRYLVVDRAFHAELSEAVDRLLADGWELHGQLHVIPGRPGVMTYLQALVQRAQPRPTAAAPRAAKYRVIASEFLEELETEVAEMLADGWELQGGVVLCGTSAGTNVWGQALVLAPA